MDLEFSDDEAQLRDSVREIVAGICPISIVREIFEGIGDFSQLWRRMVDLDWPGLTVPEAHGGVGMGYLELAIVVDQLGRACVPGPFMATVTQFVPAIRHLGDSAAQAQWLGKVARGQLTGALAIAEGGHWMAASVKARAVADGDRWVLTGRKDAVMDGASADEVVVIARADAGLGAFVVARDQLRVTPRQVLDPTLPIADIELDVVVGSERVLAFPDPSVAAALGRVIDEATVAIAVSTISTCREIFERTLQYAKEREQYGRLIGSFQALKHRFAELYLSVERASSLCWYAALTIAEDDPRRHEAACLAKAAVGECQRRLVTEGLQLHGGIGYTWEHDLHFFLKRAKAGDALFGNAYFHRAQLAQMLGLVGHGPAGELVA